MRISSLSISGFRGIPLPLSLDLSADAIVIVGNNGTGKTSIFDAILWALTGQVPRVGNSPANIVSFYSPSGQTRVELSLRSDRGEHCIIRRMHDGQESKVTFECDGLESTGRRAELEILEKFWPSSGQSEGDPVALGLALSRSVYLQQDLLREFLQDDDSQARFSAFSELIGSGRAADLQVELERACKAWSTATNRLERSAAEADEQWRGVRAQVEKLTNIESGFSDQNDREWRMWWSDASRFIAVTPPPSAKDPEALSVLSAQLRVIEQRRTVEERLAVRLADGLSEISAGVEEDGIDGEDIETLQSELSREESKLHSLNEEFQRASVAALEEHREFTKLQSSRKELQSLATLALRHLGEHCPICEQNYDVERTRRRLESIIGDTESRFSSTRMQVAGELRVALLDQRNVINRLTDRVSQAETKARQRALKREVLATELRQSGFSFTLENLTPSVVSAYLDEIRNRISNLQDLLHRGVGLSLALTKAVEFNLRNSLLDHTTTFERQASLLKGRLLRHKRTQEVANNTLKLLREVSLEAVSAQVARMYPLLEKIYARLDPHPTFRRVDLTTRLFRGRGELDARVGDPAFSDVRDPIAVFSSSQLNALAVAIFLSLNLGAPRLPMKCVMLDDPLQNLDNLHLLGLVDVLRRIRNDRQLFVSTHDARFGKLLERKLRPVSAQQRTLVVSIEGWDRDGPRVGIYEVGAQKQQRKVIAA